MGELIDYNVRSVNYDIRGFDYDVKSLRYDSSGCHSYIPGIMETNSTTNSVTQSIRCTKTKKAPQMGCLFVS